MTLPELRARGLGLAGAFTLMAALVLSACTSTPTAPLAGGTPRGPDGPPSAGSGPDPQQVPNAQPKVEPIRSGGPNKPYEVLGRSYTPMTRDEPLAEAGLASWYGRRFHGKRTASGELYNMYAMTAAHKTMPIPSYARVRNPANGREIIVRVNDRGPFSKDRVIDLSWTAAVKLGVHSGVAPVEVTRLTNDEIRAGQWPSAAAPVLAATPVPETERRTITGAEPVAPVIMAPLAAVEAATGTAPPEAVQTPEVIAGIDRQPARLDQMPVPPPGADPVPLPTNPRNAPTQARSYTTAATGFWLQLGAFSRSEGAMTFQRRVSDELDWLSPLLAVFSEGGIHRLQAGPYASREQARAAGERVREALQLVPVVVERR